MAKQKRVTVSRQGAGRQRLILKTAWLLALIAALGGVVFLARQRSGNDSVRAAANLGQRRPGIEPEGQIRAGYGGSASCKDCHAEAYELWAGSNHAHAERLPRAELDRAAFDPVRTFLHGTQTTMVRLEGDDYQIASPGLSNETETQTVARVIGHDPLRQFLVPASGGRYQAMEAAFDPFRRDWFNVYGQEDRRPGEWGHWTGRGMNWNDMCAGCHNTRVRKNYDAASDSYQTTMVEMTVGCEACHGPLRAHNEWQNRFGKTTRKDPTLAKLDRARVLDNCGFCHARRSELTGDFKPGDDFFDQYELTMVDDSETYHADGQVREEDYEYGSFLSSRMHFRGVICTDCHQPHSGKTLLPGNWLCLRCHNGTYTNAPVIEPVTHSHHKVFGFDSYGVLTNVDLTIYNPKTIPETGGECVNCHMPQTAYMQRHWRHDHGFTIPDPLLTRQFGIPNSCNRCHQGKDVAWSEAAVEEWYGARMDRPTRKRAQWIARARRGEPAARDPLLIMLAGEDLGYWRAAAATLLSPWAGEPTVRTALLQSLEHTNALVRSKAARALEGLVEQPDGVVREALKRHLDDRVRSVRLSAAWGLRATLDPASSAGGELDYLLNLHSDQPLGQLQIGHYWFARGRPEMALVHLQRAVQRDGNSAPIRHELAVVLSTVGRAGDAAEQLEAACRLDPGEAEYRYKLGLARNEQGDLARAVAALEQAVRLAPRHSRALYNLGLAYNSRGDTDNALEMLTRAESVAPDDARIPYARATIYARLGSMPEARAAAARALEVEPDFADAKELLRQLR
jgi:tetratricopeptide (TPR) repeat protein